jgi:tetratricopeptide (TPR) repeat protein
MQEPELTGVRSRSLLRQHFVIYALLCLLGLPLAASAEENITQILAEAEAFLYQNTLYLALERLREAARLVPDDYRVHKVRGDVFMSYRRNQEALAAYRQAIAISPDALDAHWTLWALLDRTGADRQALLSLKEIVRVDSSNPLVHLRLARALGQAGRLEEAVVSYRHAVALDPDNLSFRIQFARGLFDVLDYAQARQQIEMVLVRAGGGSPEWVAAHELLAHVRGETLDKGRRFNDSQTISKLPWYSEQNLREWVLARGKGWQLMEQGRHKEAEAAFRQALGFNPEDHRAMYDLGLVLMELGRYEEAIESFERGIKLTKFAEFYPDSVFQIGRCLAKLGRWKDAIVRFERVLQIQDWRHEDFYALNFPDLAKVQEALDEARQHLPKVETVANRESRPLKERYGPEPYEYPIPPLLNGHKLIDPIPAMSQFTPVGTETVRGPFRQLITARDVIQDDLQTGLHEFIPIDPTDTFSQQEDRVYLVFTLTTTQEDEVKLASNLVAVRAAGLPPNTLIATDRVQLGLNERSGYFILRRPEGGWKSGTYRVDLYMGDQISAYTHMADLWFRILAGTDQRASNLKKRELTAPVQER